MAAKPDRKLDVAEQAWPADEVKRRAVKDLVPYARNARLHSAAQIDQIAASIREWGWTNPVLVADDVVAHPPDRGLQRISVKARLAAYLS